MLTLYGPNSSFRRFSEQNLRYALFVYRVIGETLIGNFLDDPFLNRIEISVKGDTCVLLGTKGLMLLHNCQFGYFIDSQFPKFLGTIVYFDYGSSI